MSLFKKIKKWLNPQYQLVYTCLDGRTEMYTISKPSHSKEFGNIPEGRAVVGFRAYCFNKRAPRSFRYDRIVSLNRA